MRLGVSLGQSGRLADPASVRSAALAAEQVGYSSVWVTDRLPGPRNARSAEGNGGPGLPAVGATALDPLAVLTYAAAVTTRVRLGTSVLVTPWYLPGVLVRSLTSLDVLSDGRLTVGLGLDGSWDEFGATGLPEHELGRRLDDALDMLTTAWGTGDTTGDRPASPDGAVPRPLRPVQQPRPPVLLAAHTPDGLDRIARRADGWNPSGLPIEMLGPLWATVRDLAAGHGRDPDALQLVVRAAIAITERPVDGPRAAYAGTVEQVVADIVDTRRAGADEVILGLQGDHGLDETLDVYARIAEAFDVTVAA